MSAHKCCCGPEGCTCRADCNDFGSPGAAVADGCIECCWSTGDLVRFKHVWSGTFVTRNGTANNFPTPGPPTCCDLTWEGGSIEAQYVAIGCDTSCPDTGNSRPKMRFALDVDFGEVIYSKDAQAYVIETSTYRYVLNQYLALECQSSNGDGTGSGDFKWYRYNVCDEPLDLVPCVNPCLASCEEVDNSENCGEFTFGDCCPGGGNFSPWPFDCKHCVEVVHSCGGYRGKCSYRMDTMPCWYSGNGYGLGVDSDACVTGCETDADLFGNNIRGPVIECAPAFLQELTVSPPSGAVRSCKWLTDVEDDIIVKACCEKAELASGGSDVGSVPALTLTTGGHSFQDGDWGSNGTTCDCETAQPLACDAPPCPDGTDTTTSTALNVCL
jgi:hypothetical protein